MLPSKYLWPVLVLAAIFLFILYDEALTWILGLLGLGIVSETAKKSRTAANEAKDQMDYEIEQADKSLAEAENIRKEINELTDDITNEPKSPGRMRRRVKSS